MSEMEFRHGPYGKPDTIRVDVREPNVLSDIECTHVVLELPIGVSHVDLLAEEARRLAVMLARTEIGASTGPMITIEGQGPEEPVYIEPSTDGVTLSLGYVERELTREQAEAVALALLAYSTRAT